MVFRDCSAETDKGHLMDDEWVFLVQNTPNIVYDIITRPLPRKKRSRYKKAAKAAVLFVQFVLWLKSL